MSDRRQRALTVRAMWHGSGRLAKAAAQARAEALLGSVLVSWPPGVQRDEATELGYWSDPDPEPFIRMGERLIWTAREER